MRMIDKINNYPIIWLGEGDWLVKIENNFGSEDSFTIIEASFEVSTDSSMTILLDSIALDTLKISNMCEYFSVIYIMYKIILVSITTN